ncbi:GNAT family N-acetyltransferase [Cohnella fermenti]|uniref:GNAT family N-acetyltransferase n=1 Tax=Cohnella fermenti TaxID=2565925 RepID=A0A4S4BGB4_9BACL|nr:GNAT family N-acetyltransferase [Cohnella fermenti]THF73455.1 GNAT family N-acetyltransferase [Cohnella fermenti]
MTSSATFRTVTDTNNELWPAALELYHEAFPDVKGRKPDRIIAGMFGEGQGLLHALTDGESGEVQAIAFTGVLSGAKVILIDYLAVRASLRGRGLGRRLVREIEGEARRRSLDGLLIEVEAEATPDNLARIRFWERCGFRPTEYVHSYIWVPEPYRAMTLSFDSDNPLPADGKKLFKWITGFHERAFRRR